MDHAGWREIEYLSMRGFGIGAIINAFGRIGV
jgi:hypothetical protein